MITIYIGKSAAGKDTFLKKQIECGCKPIVSYTNRPARTGEVNGVDYNFVSLEEFFKLIGDDSLLEYRAYKASHDRKPTIWYYGSPRVELDSDYVGVLTIEGVVPYIKAYGSDNLKVVYVDASEEVRKERYLLRAGYYSADDDKRKSIMSEWDRRFEADERDFSESQLHYITNLLGKRVEVINNNGDIDRVTFSYIEPMEE